MIRNGRGREVGAWELASAVLCITITVAMGILSVVSIFSLLASIK
jgi:hypothetical protein